MTPPTTETIAPPRTWGKEAAEYLDSWGIVSRKPPLRSSDYSTACSDPFLYYLTRRLGLYSFHKPSVALRIGSWFHASLELMVSDPATGTSFLEDRLNTTLKGIRSQAKEATSPYRAKLGEYLEAETHRFHLGTSYFQAASKYEMYDQRTGDRFTLVDWLHRDYWVVLGIEHRFEWVHPLTKQPSVGLLDILLHNQKTNKLWIFDAKTTSTCASTRLQAVINEFQPHHYAAFVMANLPELIKAYSLPSDVTFGGVIHWAVQKPTIKFGQKDRPREKKIGPRGGVKYLYSGEPDPLLYINRCVGWLNGEGEYSHLRAEREAKPPIAMSYTPAALFEDDNHEQGYLHRLLYLDEIATRISYPSNFLRGNNLIRYDSLSDYAPFYVVHPAHWITIIKRDGFIVSHREDREEDENA